MLGVCYPCELKNFRFEHCGGTSGRSAGSVKRVFVVGRIDVVEPSNDIVMSLAHLEHQHSNRNRKSVLQKQEVHALQCHTKSVLYAHCLNRSTKNIHQPVPFNSGISVYNPVKNKVVFPILTSDDHRRHALEQPCLSASVPCSSRWYGPSPEHQHQ